VQYRAERVAAGALVPALEAAARTAGPGMTLAALAVAGSFLAFCRRITAAWRSWASSRASACWSAGGWR
jgi:hypothetical protein